MDQRSQERALSVRFGNDQGAGDSRVQLRQVARVQNGPGVEQTALISPRLPEAQTSALEAVGRTQGSWTMSAPCAGDIM